MKYSEYLYLILMIMALIFLGDEWSSLVLQGKIMLFVVVAIFAGMFYVRRAQRIEAEKAYEQELEAMEHESMDNAEPLT